MPEAWFGLARVAGARGDVAEQRRVLHRIAEIDADKIARVTRVVLRLLDELQSVIDSRRDVLDELRDSSVFVLAQRKLEAAVETERGRRALEIVSDYSKKAVVGGLAAITPGSDLVIQGVLGTRMVRELSALYDVPVRQADTDLLIELVQKHVGKTKTLMLAIAGNGLKAFPGVGTIAVGVAKANADGITVSGNGGGTGHVHFHGLDAAGRLQVDSSRVEGDPLAHEDQGLLGAGGTMVQHDHQGLLLAAAAHRQQGAEPQPCDMTYGHETPPRPLLVPTPATPLVFRRAERRPPQKSM